MAFLFHDIVLDDTAFTTASQEMAILKQDAANLKLKLEKMYENVSTALDTSRRGNSGYCKGCIITAN